MTQDEYQKSVNDLIDNLMKPMGKIQSIEQKDEVTYIAHFESGVSRWFMMGSKAREALQRAYEEYKKKDE